MPKPSEMIMDNPGFSIHLEYVRYLKMLFKSANRPNPTVLLQFNPFYWYTQLPLLNNNKKRARNKPKCNLLWNKIFVFNFWEFCNASIKIITLSEYCIKSNCFTHMYTSNYFHDEFNKESIEYEKGGKSYRINKFFFLSNRFI